MTVMLAMVTLLAGLVLIAVLASTVRALAMASANSRLRRDGVRATGTVVDNTMTSTPQRQLLFSPVVEFHARTGELVSAPAQQRAARSWPRGSTVEIAYDPAEPYRFVLAGEPERGQLVANTIVGVIVVVVMVGTMVVTYRIWSHFRYDQGVEQPPAGIELPYDEPPQG